MRALIKKNEAQEKENTLQLKNGYIKIYIQPNLAIIFKPILTLEYLLLHIFLLNLSQPVILLKN